MTSKAMFALLLFMSVICVVTSFCNVLSAVFTPHKGDTGEVDVAGEEEWSIRAGATVGSGIRIPYCCRRRLCVCGRKLIETGREPALYSVLLPGNLTYGAWLTPSPSHPKKTQIHRGFSCLIPLYTSRPPHTEP
ncbi:hypothetical protein IQ06DRAFT_126965 [Phaeosphaeriaceae sp. SRC1lsM3a]|nr:hypothetical protein IQ06DRAFT_126965 [Stagonospora sp. SRC1lsM3a]